VGRIASPIRWGRNRRSAAYWPFANGTSTPLVGNQGCRVRSTRARGDEHGASARRCHETMMDGLPKNGTSGSRTETANGAVPSTSIVTSAERDQPVSTRTTYVPAAMVIVRRRHKTGRLCQHGDSVSWLRIDTYVIPSVTGHQPSGCLLRTLRLHATVAGSRSCASLSCVTPRIYASIASCQGESTKGYAETGQAARLRIGAISGNNRADG
jgi:hypothetical protein